jgi:diaminopimelate decarboxylase
MSKMDFKKIKTPCFVYDKNIVHSQIDKILNAFNKYKNFQLFFSIKANNSEIILKEIKKRHLGISVSSIEELEKAKKQNIKKISYTSPLITKRIVNILRKNNSEINFNNITDFDKFGINGDGLRINPEIGWSYLKDYQASSKRSQFGIPINEIDSPNLYKIERLHFHSSSDSYKIDIFIEGLKRILNVAHKFPNLSTINIGGGIAVPILKNDKEFNIKKYAKKVVQTIKEFNKKNKKNIIIQFEPGNYIIRPAGYYVCRLLSKEKKSNLIYYFSDGTRHHFKGISRVERFFFDKKNNLPKKMGIIVGKTCQRSDVLIEKQEIPILDIGNFLVIPETGAYCIVQSDNFHLFKKPKEYLLE